MAIPTVILSFLHLDLQIVDPALKEELNADIYNILRPIVADSISLMNFCLSSIQILVKLFQTITTDLHQSSEVIYLPSATLTDKIAECVSALIDIDAVKNIKGSISNDLSLLKRFAGISRR